MNKESKGNTLWDGSLKEKVEKKETVNTEITEFKIPKKRLLSDSKVPAQIYIPKEKATKIENLCRLSGNSKNEVINLLLDYALDHAIVDE